MSIVSHDHPTLRYAAFTHRGKPFPHNQDALLAEGRVIQAAEFLSGVLPAGQPHRFAVSDGVSSSPQPATASRKLLTSLLDTYAKFPQVSPGVRVEYIQTRLAAALKKNRRLEDSAATLIVAEVTGSVVCLWHAGDSRGYRVARNQAMRLTQDHTARNVLQVEGYLSAEDAAALAGSGLANAPYNLFVYAPLAEPPTVSVQTVPLIPGEVLLLVSDGVTTELSDGEIAACIDVADLPGSAQHLYDAVMAKGAGDDLSAILLAL